MFSQAAMVASSGTPIPAGRHMAAPPVVDGPAFIKYLTRTRVTVRLKAEPISAARSPAPKPASTSISPPAPVATSDPLPPAASAAAKGSMVVGEDSMAAAVATAVEVAGIGERVTGCPLSKVMPIYDTN